MFNELFKQTDFVISIRCSLSYVDIDVSGV